MKSFLATLWILSSMSFAADLTPIKLKRYNQGECPTHNTVVVAFLPTAAKLTKQEFQLTVYLSKLECQPKEKHFVKSQVSSKDKAIFISYDQYHKNTNELYFDYSTPIALQIGSYNDTQLKELLISILAPTDSNPKEAIGKLTRDEVLSLIHINLIGNLSEYHQGNHNNSVDRLFIKAKLDQLLTPEEREKLQNGSAVDKSTDLVLYLNHTFIPYQLNFRVYENFAGDLNIELL